MSLHRLIAVPLLAVAHGAALASYDPASEYVEAAAVARRFPDPDIALSTPGFAPERHDFTSHAEMLAYLEKIRAGAPDLHLRVVGSSQRGLSIPLAVLARGAASGADVVKNGRPTVLVIGLQHGNEPAGGEAALAFIEELASARDDLLGRVNVLVVPRANPDGARDFVRGLANGGDVNRDHLLVATPEGAALASVMREYQPDVVLDCHEFGVKTRWYEKFGGLQRYDALVQYATVSNLPRALTDLADRRFRVPLEAALDASGFTHSWYYASSYDMSDKVVSMGGVVPDTGRNIAGLRNAVSFLIETRGVGIGRAHFRRRVATHLVAMRAFVRAAAEHADEVVSTLRQVREHVAASAGRGDIAVIAAATPARHTIDLVDPSTGADRPVEVDWRDALSMTVRLSRPRPYAYVLAASETRAVSRLALLGVTVERLAADADADVDAERYEVTAMSETKKDDVRRNDDDAATSVVRLTTRLVRERVPLRRGDWYVRLDQPLANVVVAALEPETQSSYAANRMITLPEAAGPGAFLPLVRVAQPIALPAFQAARD